MRCLKSSIFGKIEIYNLMKLAEKVVVLLILSHNSLGRGEERLEWGIKRWRGEGRGHKV